MFKKIKENDKYIEFVMSIVFGVIASFYIIYKLSNSLFMVVMGMIILSVGYFSKDSTLKEEKPQVEQLTISSEEVIKPSIIIKKDKIKKSERAKA